MGLLDLRWGILVGYGPLFVAGVWMTLQPTMVALTGGLVLGVVLGLVSSSADAPKPPSMLTALAWSKVAGPRLPSPLLIYQPSSNEALPPEKAGCRDRFGAG